MVQSPENTQDKSLLLAPTLALAFSERQHLSTSFRRKSNNCMKTWGCKRSNLNDLIPSFEGCQVLTARTFSMEDRFSSQVQESTKIYTNPQSSTKWFVSHQQFCKDYSPLQKIPYPTSFALQIFQNSCHGRFLQIRDCFQKRL